MNKLLETIKIDNGKICHLSYHQDRCNYSLQKFGINITHNLQEMIKPPTKGIFRCRVVYDATTVSVSYHPYTFTPISSLKLLVSDVEYPLKFDNRTELNRLYKQRETCDDILIIKNDYITDTTRANIALFDGSRWYTPSQPLLFGTTRQRLLEDKKIFEKQIHINDLDSFIKIAVMNAMVGFCIVKNGIIQTVIKK